MDGNYSLADIAAATGNGRNNDGMFGGDGAWVLLGTSSECRSCAGL